MTNGDGLQTPDDELNDLSSEDEAVANDLDMHALILNGLHGEHDEPIKTAEEVIKEIDDIMDETTPSEGGGLESEVMEKAKEVLGSPLYEESKYHFFWISGLEFDLISFPKGNMWVVQFLQS